MPYDMRYDSTVNCVLVPGSLRSTEECTFSVIQKAFSPKNDFLRCTNPGILSRDVHSFVVHSNFPFTTLTFMSLSDADSSSSYDEGGPPNEAAPVPVVMRRRRFSVQQKMNLIRTVARLMQQEGMCCVEACRDVNIHPSMHLKWMPETCSNND